MKQCATRWISSYRRDYLKRVLEKQDEDLQKLVTPEDVQQFNRSEPAVTAVKLLGAVSSGNKVLSQHEYTLVRDFIMSQIVFNNANRSGVMSEVTVQQVKNARVVDGRHVVSVVVSKTLGIYGPAKLILTDSLHSWLQIYLDRILARLFPSIKPSTNAFLSWNGKALEGGQVSRCLQSLFKKAGMRDDITCTLFRKTAVSTMHQKHPEMKADLADLMCHRQETENKRYRLVQREKTSVAAAVKLSQFMANKSASETVSKPCQDEQGEAQLPAEAETMGERFAGYLIGLMTIHLMWCHLVQRAIFAFLIRTM